MIISFPDGHFGRNKQRPLSPLMIAALMVLCAKQKDGILFKSKDVKSSFTALVNRGLLVSKTLTKDGQKESRWEVTAEAIEMLNDLGIEVPS